MKIHAVNHLSTYLAAVKALGKANAATLGLFPEGAFDDYARKGTILVAINDQGHCQGYLLYRVTRGYASIVHLCVAAHARGRGLARALLNHLYELSRPLRGIRADCRRDYAASSMWPRLGFCAINERAGRAKIPTMLTIWWLDHRHPDLFTEATMNQVESKLRVAIDANIFYDLQNETRPDRDESLALLADWLQAEIDLGVSDELWNEINRGNDHIQRRQARQAAERLTRLTCKHDDFEAVQARLRSLFPDHLSPNDEADLRQLARAIAAGVSFFVTRDADLLARTADLHTMYEVSVLRPSDLIVHLDELRRAVEYQPARLAGTLMGLRRVQSKEQTIFAPVFTNEALSETRADFDRLLRRMLAQPTTYECLVAFDDDHHPLALLVYDRTKRDELTIPVLRVRRGSLAATLARYFILSALTQATDEQRLRTRITDQYLDNMVITALQEDAFISTPDGWIKLNLSVAETANKLATQLQTLAHGEPIVESYVQKLVSMLTTENIAFDATRMAEMEHALWPAKIVDAAIPTFLVPIQPTWAHELFDVGLANQTLFGTTKRLALNREGIYYKSRRPEIFSAPGRILWYVSQDKQQRFHGGGAVRACSRLEEVIIGLPKDLYRRFRRFGIYAWENVLAAAKNDIEQPIMVLRFCNTELFPTPVSRQILRSFYTDVGGGLQLQGPSRITQDLFARIYRHGKESTQK